MTWNFRNLALASVLVVPAAIVSSIDFNSTPVFAQTVTELSEEQIVAIMDELEQAQLDENIDKFLEYLAPFVISNITVEIYDDTITRNLEGKQEHAELLTSTYGLVASREILDKTMEVDISEDGQLAVVKRTVTKQLVSEEGQEYLSYADDVIRFALIDGKPMIISIDSDGWLAEE